MILILDKKQSISLVLARNYNEEIGNNYSLKLFNEYGNEEFLFDVTDTSNDKSFYRFNVDFSMLKDIEYAYELINENCGLVLECGLIRFLPSTENKIFNNDEEIVIYNG